MNGVTKLLSALSVDHKVIEKKLLFFRQYANQLRSAETWTQSTNVITVTTQQG